MTALEVETTIEEIRLRIGALKDCAQADILSIPFETIARIETLGADLYTLAGRLKTARGIELEKWFVSKSST